MVVHKNFVTTSRGLNRNLPAMRLYEKAKRLGVWNPAEIDLSQDIDDWQGLTEAEQDLLLRLTTMFQAGEEAVTLDLLPLIMAIAAEDRLEEEMFLATFLFEEAKHTDFFWRFLDEIAKIEGDLSHYHTPHYRTIFYEVLPQTLQALMADRSPKAQIKASAVYNMLVEGMLAETGYHAYFSVLRQRGIMPGTQQGIQLLKQDESRHIAYGVFLISRLIANDDGLWQVFEDTMNQWLETVMGIIGDAFACYEVMPFGLVENDFIDYALSQFGKRMDRIEKARGASLEEIYRTSHSIIEADDG